MKIVIKTKDNKDLCDIDIDEYGCLFLSDCTMEDIDADDHPFRVNYLEVKLVK